jgi:hypothetical protein
LALDIDFLERVKPDAARSAYLCLHFFAKSTAGPGIKNNSHSRFHFGFSLPRRSWLLNVSLHNANYPLANAAANVV